MYQLLCFAFTKNLEVPYTLQPCTSYNPTSDIEVLFKYIAYEKYENFCLPTL